MDASYLLGNTHNMDRTVNINAKVAQTIRNWVDTGILSISTIYGKFCDGGSKIFLSFILMIGFGLLNEPHICGYQSLNLLKEACLQYYYPRGYAAIRLDTGYQ